MVAMGHSHCKRFLDTDGDAAVLEALSGLLQQGGVTLPWRRRGERLPDRDFFLRRDRPVARLPREEGLPRSSQDKPRAATHQGHRHLHR